MLERMWSKGNTLKLQMGFELVQTLWKSVWQILKKLVISLPQDPAIPLLDIYSKDAQSYYKGICSTMFIVALFIIAETWKQPKCP